MSLIKRVKHVLILLMLVIFLCSLTAISANEYNDTTTTESHSPNEPEYDNTLTSSSMDTYTQPTESITTKNIQKNKNTDLTKTSSNNGTQSELKKLLDDASTGSTVYLEKDYYIETPTPIRNKDPITINKTLTIDGQGHTLDGSHHMRIFKITADNVVLRNINFINAFSELDSGGVAIDWLGNNGVLEDCTFKDCIPRSEGAITGTVYIKGDSFTAKNCYFENNAAFRGAGFYLNSNNNNIINCTFNRNNGYNDDFEHQLYLKHSAGSGIFINGDNNYINKCVFLNQSTVYGTIYVNGEKNLIKNSIFRNNYVYRDGGAIYINQENNEILDCIIENNTAKEDGGAIYINDNDNEIYDCIISNNSANKGGGAIYINYKDNEIYDCIISNNSANTSGGAIYINDINNKIHDCSISKNSANTSGGALCIKKQDNHINSCIIYDNMAFELGGGIYVDAKNNQISNNMFANNYMMKSKDIKDQRNDIYSRELLNADKNWWGNVNTDVCHPLDSYMKKKMLSPSTNNKLVRVNNWYYLDVTDKLNNTIPKKIDLVGKPFDGKIMFKLYYGKGDFNYPNLDNEYNLTGDKLGIFDGFLYKDNLVKEFTGNSLEFNILSNNIQSYLRIKNDIFGIEVPFTFRDGYSLSKLQEIINNAGENDTVELHENYVYNPDVDKNLKEGIIVNKTLTIEGNGHTIDCDNKVRGFYVTADDVQFNNIIIKNGKAYNGAAITFEGNGGIVDNSTFQFNFAETDGGAIYSYGEDTFINNSKFDRNYAVDKGAALYSNGKFFKYSNNIFTNNQAKNGRSICVEGPYYYSFSGWDNNTYHNNTYLDYGGDASDDKTTYPTINKKQLKTVTRSISPSMKKVSEIILTSNNKKITIINNHITLESLNEIFNMDFRNGHLLVYIDGKLVFNGTTTDDLTQIIYDLLKLVSGSHELKVEFTNSEGKTDTYTETITV